MVAKLGHRIPQISNMFDIQHLILQPTKLHCKSVFEMFAHKDERMGPNKAWWIPFYGYFLSKRLVNSNLKKSWMYLCNIFIIFLC